MEYANAGGEIKSIHIYGSGQEDDALFMLNLYKSSNGKLFFHEPSKHLQTDIDFMIEYFNIRLEEKITFQPENNAFSPDLIDIVKSYKALVKSPFFLVKLNKAFPKCNLLKLINKSFCSNIINDKNNDAINVIEKLPSDLLIQQARLLGEEFVSMLNKNHPDYMSVVSAGIECDGFKSLKLDKKDIIENKMLIIKAFEKDGVEKLQEYLTSALSSLREENYMCHGEPHTDSYFDKDYIAIKNYLINDKQFLSGINIKDQEKNNLIKAVKTKIAYEKSYIKMESERQKSEECVTQFKNPSIDLDK